MMFILSQICNLNSYTTNKYIIYNTSSYLIFHHGAQHLYSNTYLSIQMSLRSFNSSFSIFESVKMKYRGIIKLQTEFSTLLLIFVVKQTATHTRYITINKQNFSTSIDLAHKYRYHSCSIKNEATKCTACIYNCPYTSTGIYVSDLCTGTQYYCAGIQI